MGLNGGRKRKHAAAQHAARGRKVARGDLPTWQSTSNFGQSANRHYFKTLFGSIMNYPINTNTEK